MEELTTQLRTLLEGKKNILIVSHQKIDGDGLSSMLVLKKLFERMDKEVTALSLDDIPEIYHFLPSVNEVERTLRSSNDFIISLKTDGVEVDKLKYSVDGDTLNIVVSPKKGLFLPENIHAKQAVGKYDLIFVLDSGDLEHLGAFYEEHTEMFYETPIVNIDHHTTNTAFGQINIVDVMAASTTQIVCQLMHEMIDDETARQNFFNADIATLLLTGLIVDTGSFQHTNTSPKSLELAADLIEMGARQQEIIQNIYKTKQLSTLKLWGRVLAKIEEDPIRKMVWSTITKEDLQETGASVEEAEGLIDELMTNAPGAEVVALMKNSFDGSMTCSLRSTNVTIDTLPIANHFGGGGHKQASGFKQKGYNFGLFTADVIDFIEKYQEERLGLTAEDVATLRGEYETKQKQREIGMRHKQEETKTTETLDIISEISGKAEEGRVEIRRAEAHKKSEAERQKAPHESSKLKVESSESSKFKVQSSENLKLNQNQNQKSNPNQSQKPNQNLHQKPNQNPSQKPNPNQNLSQKQNQNQNQAAGNKPVEVKKEEKAALPKPVVQDAVPQTQVIETPKAEPVAQTAEASAPVQVSPVIEEVAAKEVETVAQTAEALAPVQVSPVIEEVAAKEVETVAPVAESVVSVQAEAVPEATIPSVQAESPAVVAEMPVVQESTPTVEALPQSVPVEVIAEVPQIVAAQPVSATEEVSQAIQFEQTPAVEISSTPELKETVSETAFLSAVPSETPIQEQQPVAVQAVDDNKAVSVESTPTAAASTEPSFLSAVQQAIPVETVQQQAPVAQTTPFQAVVQQQATVNPQAQQQTQQYAQYQQAQAQQAQYAQQQAQPMQQQQAQPQVTKEQAGQYAQYYAQQLHQMNPQTAEYAQIYQYYSYYAQMAQ